MEKEIEVSVCCITYNQEKYIRKMLDSVIGQETKFAYEILVHDDASTDFTGDVVKEYANKYSNILTAIIQEENQFSLGKRDILFNQLLPRVRGKYIAMCEGDDYWCDMRKLQKQYDFMERHKECALCAHGTGIIFENGHETGKKIPAIDVKEIMTSDEYISYCIENDTHIFHTSSIFFKKEDANKLLQNQPEFYRISPVGDRVMFLYYATKGNVGYLNEEMSCYRTMSDGSWTKTMVSSKEKTYEKNCGMLKMVKAFDQYTGGRYHKEAYEFETLYNFVAFQYELRCREMLQKRYRNLYKRLSSKEKLFFGICAFCPRLGKGYRRMKKKLIKQGN